MTGKYCPPGKAPKPTKPPKAKAKAKGKGKLSKAINDAMDKAGM